MNVMYKNRIFIMLLIIAAALFLFQCSNNIYSPLVQQVNSGRNATDINDRDLLNDLAELAYYESRYDDALMYYDRLLELFPNDSEARLNATRVIWRRDETALIEMLIKLMDFQNDEAGYVTFVSNSSLFTATGSVNSIINYLDNNNGYSLVDGQCDNVIETNSLTANMHLMIAYIMKLSSSFLDTSGNYIYNEQGNNGDLIIYSNNGFTLNTDYDALLTNIEKAAANMSERTNLDPANMTPTNEILQIDTCMELMHDAVEGLLDTFKSFSFTIYLEEVTACINRIASRNPGSSLDEVYALINNNLSSVLDAPAMNDMTVRELIDMSDGVFSGSNINIWHSNMNGDWAYTPIDDIQNYTGPSQWPDFHGITIRDDNNQGRLKIWYTNLLNLTNFTNNPPVFFSNYTNTFNSFSNFYTNFKSNVDFTGGMISVDDYF
jgi:tetratricopeptide (TPR) repeat protein